MGAKARGRRGTAKGEDESSPTKSASEDERERALEGEIRESSHVRIG